MIKGYHATGVCDTGYRLIVMGNFHAVVYNFTSYGALPPRINLSIQTAAVFFLKFLCNSLVASS